MSANFYDTNGYMGGLDSHIFLEAKGPVPIPKSTYHLVCCSYLHACNSKYTDTVTSDAAPMITGHHDLEAVIHLPIPPGPPHVAELGMLALIILKSSSKPALSAHSVTGERTPLAVCVSHCIGVNSNCSGVGVVLAPNTVKTQPTAGDYMAAAASMAISLAWSKFKGGFLEGLFGKDYGPSVKEMWDLYVPIPTLVNLVKTFVNLPDLNLSHHIQHLVDDHHW